MESTNNPEVLTTTTGGLPVNTGPLSNWLSLMFFPTGTILPEYKLLGSVIPLTTVNHAFVLLEPSKFLHFEAEFERYKAFFNSAEKSNRYTYAIMMRSYMVLLGDLVRLGLDTPEHFQLINLEEINKNEDYLWNADWTRYSELPHDIQHFVNAIALLQVMADAKRPFNDPSLQYVLDLCLALSQHDHRDKAYFAQLVEILIKGEQYGVLTILFNQNEKNKLPIFTQLLTQDQLSKIKEVESWGGSKTDAKDYLEAYRYMKTEAFDKFRKDALSFSDLKKIMTELYAFPSDNHVYFMRIYYKLLQEKGLPLEFVTPPRSKFHKFWNLHLCQQKSVGPIHNLQDQIEVINHAFDLYFDNSLDLLDIHELNKILQNLIQFNTPEMVEKMSVHILNRIRQAIENFQQESPLGLSYSKLLFLAEEQFIGLTKKNIGLDRLTGPMEFFLKAVPESTSEVDALAYENIKATFEIIKYLQNPHYPISHQAIKHSVLQDIQYGPKYASLILSQQQLPHPPKIDQPYPAALPLILRFVIKPEDYDAFVHFYNSFDKANNFSRRRNQREEDRERYVRDFSSVVIQKTPAIINLYEIMGPQSFTFLSTFLSTSVLKLERFLDSFKMINGPYIPILKDFFANLKNIDYSQTEMLLTKISLQLELDNDIFHSTGVSGFEKLKEFAQTAKSIEELDKLFGDYLIRSYLDILKIDTKNMSYGELVKILPPGRLSDLLVGRRAMTNNNYREVFDEMVRTDIDPNLSFRTFTTDPEQTSPIGKKLAAHNLNVVDQLKKSGIDTEQALHYQKTLSFKFEGKTTTTLNPLLWTLYQQTLALQQVVNQLMESTTNESILKKLAPLQKQINNYLKQISKGLKTAITPDNLDFLTKIKNENNVQLVKKIAGATGRMKDQFQQSDLPEEKLVTFREISGDLTRNLDTLETHLSQLETASDTKALKATKQYRVEQWDKEKIDTFFLGNMLSCCLATDGAQFPAIVQRRMDQAMFMHVVIDEDTQEPVCGNWLFFNDDANDKNKTYVCANFFEIRSSIGLQKELRDALTANLLYFTGEMFTKDIKAEDFLMRQLSYGMIPDFKFFDMVKMSIEKVGGFLSLDDSTDAKNLYYLLALDEGYFYKFDVEKLRQHFSQVALPVSSKLEDETSLLARTDKGEKDILTVEAATSLNKNNKDNEEKSILETTTSTAHHRNFEEEIKDQQAITTNIKTDPKTLEEKSTIGSPKVIDTDREFEQFINYLKKILKENPSQSILPSLTLFSNQTQVILKHLNLIRTTTCAHITSKEFSLDAEAFKPIFSGNGNLSRLNDYIDKCASLNDKSFTKDLAKFLSESSNRDKVAVFFQKFLLTGEMPQHQQTVSPSHKH